MLTADLSRLGVRAGDLVLDLGCGGGRHAFEAVSRGGRVVAVDLSAEEVRRVAFLLGGRGDALVADALALPFPDGTFDRVVAAEVLEHIPDDGGALAELYRVTRPGGTVAVTVPRFWPELVCWTLSGAYHSRPGGHVRIYRASQLLLRLRAAGLSPRWIGFAHALHSPYWWLRCAADGSRAADLYRRFLEWDIAARPMPVRLLERALDPVLGKSLVIYLRRSPSRPAAGSP